jgi:hypothetical protein
MPSSLRLNGLTIYKPGVYGNIDASALGGSNRSSGNIALVGEFPSLEAAVPLTFTSARAVSDYHDDLDLTTAAKLLFKPSTDSRVPGGAASVTVLNVQPNTRASVTLQDTAPADSLKLSAKLWGPVGNQTFYTVTDNVLGGWDFYFARQGATETFNGVKSGDICDLYYDGSELDTVTATVDEIEWAIQWTKDMVFLAPGGAQSVVYTPVEFLSGDQIFTLTLANGGAGASGNNVLVTIVGIDEAGVPQTEVKTALAGFTTFVLGADTANKWGSITSITISTADVAYDGTVTIAGHAFKLATADYNNIGEITSYIDQNSAKGFHADALHPRINKIPAAPDLTADGKAGGVDKQTSIDCLSPAKCTPQADLWEIVRVLLGSNLIVPERSASADLPIDASGTPQGFLVGGSKTTTVATDWDDALETIETLSIQIEAWMTQTYTLQAKAIAHAEACAREGYERNVWLGAAPDLTLQQLFDQYSKLLNSRHTSIAVDEIQISNSKGDAVWKDPEWTALIFAGMQAGTEAGEPLTWKRPDVLDTDQSWDSRRDIGDAISKGLVAIDSDNLGFRVARSVTTWLEDDNPVFSEVSANESINTAILDIRGYVQGSIGTKVRAGSAKRLEAIVATRLNQLVLEGVIKAWRNLSTDDLGDTIRINIEIAPVEPLNFVVIQVNAVRIAA